MQRGLTGSWLLQSVDGRDYEAFLPEPLPPVPEMQWTAQLIANLTKATESVARLDGAARLLPDLHLLIYTYVRKEAVLSSQIEGTQSSLSDLLMFESEAMPGVPIDDVNEVVRYVRALESGIERIRTGELISIDLILDLHRILLSTGRGSDKAPGTFRVGQNWIGGLSPDRASFVPPPPEHLRSCLDQLLSYWQSSTDHTLLKAAYVHLQFETIHPFRDGNGRIGRLLITLLLCQEKLIAEPMIYLSLYFKENREAYYAKLQDVRINGTWEDWVHFFLTGVLQISDSAFRITQQIQALFNADNIKIRTTGGRKTGGMRELYKAAQESPILSIPRAEKILHGSVSKPTLYAAAIELVNLGILRPVERDKSGTQLYAYDQYIELLVRA